MLTLFEALTYHLLGDRLHQFLEHAMGDREGHPAVAVGAPGPEATVFRVEPLHRARVVSVSILHTRDRSLRSCARLTEVQR